MIPIPNVNHPNCLEIMKLVDQIQNVDYESDEYDMYGFVVDKLPTEQYANHYNVKGDNDEIFICWYAGDDILGAGTEVGMTHISQDNGWKIEPIMHV